MARGSCIVVTSPNNGKWDEGKLGAGVATAKPGTWLQKDPSVALVGGRHTFVLYAPGVDGEKPKGALWILTEPQLLPGADTTYEYVAGEHIDVYCPEPGDQLNVLLLNISGTADDHPIGEKLIIDHSTGKCIVTTGSPETEIGVTLEVVTDPVVDTLVWIEYSGY